MGEESSKAYQDTSIRVKNGKYSRLFLLLKLQVWKKGCAADFSIVQLNKQFCHWKLQGGL